MANLINIQYGSKVCQLPKSLVNSEEFMKEIVSANVWNNKLKKSDKMNLLKFLPTFSQNDTHEKKETLKKLFLGKPINFENQIKKFVYCVKDGDFTPSVKSEKVIDLLLKERRGRFTLLKQRINDLKKIIDTKKSMGLDISAEETNCMNEFGHLLNNEDSLDDVVESKLAKIMSRVSDDADVVKKNELYLEHDEYMTVAVEKDERESLQMLSLSDVVNRCQNDSGIEEKTTALGPMTRKRRQLCNGFEERLTKYARMKWERRIPSSASQSESSENGNENSENNEESGTSDDTDSVASGAGTNDQRHVRNSRHERREFRCPQEDMPDFFSLLQRLFVGAHQHKLTTGQIEERVRHWQTVNQRNICAGYNSWAAMPINEVGGDWTTVVVSALTYLSGSVKEGGAIVEYRRGRWRWRGAGVSGTVLRAACEEWARRRRRGERLGGGTPTEVAEQQIAPPLYRTSWRVRPSTEEERLQFQAQERRRFSRPYRGFTYNVHGYCSVVSPVRGCVYGGGGGGSGGRDSSGGVRARGHPLLVSDRPPHVNIVEIVRDAVARLPNGEGSRADIVTLAMDSGYWSCGVAGDKTVSQCISSALDRLQGEGCDPSVKYNSRLKLWFYRHRHRTVEELEKAHFEHCKEELRRSKCHNAALMVSRPTYQQFSRAVTHARHNVVYPFRPPQSPAQYPSSSNSSSLNNIHSSASLSSPHDFYYAHQPHFYY